MQTFDPTQFIISLGSLTINSGMVKGSYLKVATNEDAFKMVSGVNSVVLVRMHDFTAVATITLMQNSAINDLLSDWHLANLRPDNIPETRPFQIKDLLGTTVAGAPNGIIAKTPDFDRASDDASPSEWMIILDKFKGRMGGANS